MTTTNTAAASLSECDFVAVPRAAVEWLKEHYPALTEKAGMCERIGKRLYTKTSIAIPIPQADATPSELREAARQFHNLTQGDSAVIIRAPSAEKRDAIIAAGERLRAAIAAVGAQEPIYQTCFIQGQWRDVDRAEYDRAKGLRADLARIVYAAPLPREAATENEALSLLRGWYEANAKGTVMVEDAAYRLVAETAALLAAATNGEQA